jgi:hypothetical protein
MQCENLLRAFSVLHVRRINHGDQEQSERVNKDMTLASDYFLYRIIAGIPPPSVVFMNCESRIAAEG